jgi:hypothetical protein
MAIAKVEVERFSLTTANPFEAVVTALKSEIGRPDIVKFFKATSAARSFPHLERIVQSAVGRMGLMLFAEFDLGAILRRETGLETPKLWSSTFRMPGLTRQSLSLWMNLAMAFTSPTTKWRALCCLTVVRPLSSWPEISTRRLQAFCRNAQAERAMSFPGIRRPIIGRLCRPLNFRADRDRP